MSKIKVGASIVFGLFLSLFFALTFDAAAKEAEYAEKTRYFLGIVGTMILSLIAIATIIFFIVKKHRKRQRLTELLLANANEIRRCQEKISEARSEEVQAQNKLALLKQESPKEIWESLESRLVELPTKCANLSRILIACEVLHKKGLKYADETSEKLSGILAYFEKRSSILGDIQTTRSNIDFVKKKSQEILKSFPGELAETTKIIDHIDVTIETKGIAIEAAAMFGEAADSSNCSLPNWLYMYHVLEIAKQSIALAQSNARRDIEFAEKSRIEGPKLFAKFPNLINEAKAAVKDPDVSIRTRAMVSDAEADFKDVRQVVNKYSHWPELYSILLDAEEQLEKAKRQAGDNRPVEIY